MKVLAVQLLLVLCIALAGCGAAEEPEPDTGSEVAVETLAEEQIVEVDETAEDVVVSRQLPDPWPGSLLLPEGMIVIVDIANEEGYPLLVTQFSEDAEPLALADVYAYYRGLDADPEWTLPMIEENDSTLTSSSFHLDLFHSEHFFVSINGSSDPETGLVSVELTWMN